MFCGFVCWCCWMFSHVLRAYSNTAMPYVSCVWTILLFDYCYSWYLPCKSCTTGLDRDVGWIFTWSFWSGGFDWAVVSSYIRNQTVHYHGNFVCYLSAFFLFYVFTFWHLGWGKAQKLDPALIKTKSKERIIPHVSHNFYIIFHPCRDLGNHSFMESDLRHQKWNQR